MIPPTKHNQRRSRYGGSEVTERSEGAERTGGSREVIPPEQPALTCVARHRAQRGSPAPPGLGQRKKRRLVEAIIQVFIDRSDLINRDIDAVLVRLFSKLVDRIGEQDLAATLVAELATLLE